MPAEPARALSVSYPRVYYAERNWKWFAIAFGLGLLAGAVAAGISAVAPVSGGLAERVLRILLMLVLAYAGFFSFFTGLRAKIVLFSDRIAQFHAFSVQVARRSEIAGYEPGELGSLIVVPCEGRPLVIHETSEYQLDEAFFQWLSGLPVLPPQRPVREPDPEPEFGTSPEEWRAEQWRAKWFARVMNLTAYAVSVASFGVEASAPLLIVLAAFPLLAIGLVKWTHGLVRIGRPQNDHRPQTAAALFFPGIALFARVFTDGRTLDWAPAVLLSLAVAAVLALVAVKAVNPERRVVSAGTIPALALACMYSMGAVVVFNQVADASPGSYYSSTLLSKHVFKGKSTSYQFTLGPGGPFPEPHNINVAWQVYQSVEPGAAVCFVLHPGKLGFRWYSVGCSGAPATPPF
jgi:hypothetical protein